MDNSNRKSEPLDDTEQNIEDEEAFNEKELAKIYKNFYENSSTPTPTPTPGSEPLTKDEDKDKDNTDAMNKSYKILDNLIANK